MKLEVRLEGLSGKILRIVELERNASGWRILLDGQTVDADAVEIAPYTFSILLNGQSYEIRVSPAPDGKFKLQTGTREFTSKL